MSRLTDRITKGPIRTCEMYADAEVRGADDELIAVTTSRPHDYSNARFIAEAFTVAHQHGMSPAELVAQRDELVELLKRAIDPLAIFATYDWSDNGRLIQTINEALAKLEPK